jgi:hypothetical protein
MPVCLSGWDRRRESLNRFPVGVKGEKKKGKRKLALLRLEK